MPDEIKTPADQEFERAIEENGGAVPAPTPLLYSLAAGGTGNITLGDNTANITLGNNAFTGAIVNGSISLSETVDTTVRTTYGNLKKSKNCVEIEFNTVYNLVKMPRFSTYMNTATTTSSSNWVGNSEPNTIPDLSDRIKSFSFWVANDDLKVQIKTDTNEQIRFMCSPNGWGNVFGSINDHTIPEETHIADMDTNKDAREIMLGHLFMFDKATGLNPEEVSREIYELYKHHAKAKLPEWLDNVTFREKMLYMTSPLMREANSEAVLLNAFGRAYGEYGITSNWNRKELGLTFKQICAHKIGSDSSTTMKALWDVLFMGGELRSFKYDDSTVVMNEDIKLYMENHWSKSAGLSRKKYESERGAVWIGDRNICWDVITMTAAIREAFGVDHMRNFLLNMKKSLDKNIETRKNTVPGQIDPTPNIHAMLSRSISNGYGEENSKKGTVLHLKEMTKFCSPQKILKGLADGQLGLMRDALDCWRQYNTADKIPEKLKAVYPNGIEIPKSWGTFREFHDKISKAHNLIQEEATNIVFEDFPHYFYGLDGLSEGELSVEIARETKQLVRWGRDLKLCVGSYGPRVKQKQALMVSFKKNGKPLYVMHLNWPTIVEYVETGKLTPRVKHVFGYAAGVDDREVPTLGEKGVMRPIDCAVEANVEYKIDGNKVPSKEEYDVAHNMIAKWIEGAVAKHREKIDAEARTNDAGKTVPNLTESVPEMVELGRGNQDEYGPHLTDDGSRAGGIQSEGDLGGTRAAGGDSPMRLGLELAMAEGPRPQDEPRAAGPDAG